MRPQGLLQGPRHASTTSHHGGSTQPARRMINARRRPHHAPPACTSASVLRMHVCHGSGVATSTARMSWTRPRRSVLVAASSGAAASRTELPIFPLGMVALPHATVPLMIFEPRYRVLFNTLLSGGEGVDEGLVQKESPFCGTRRFGMAFADEKGRLASIGTTLEIAEYLHEGDGRIYVTCKGLERFKITKVATERPVLICEVEMLPEDKDDSTETRQLSGEVAELFRNTLRLHVKMARARAAKRAGSGGSPAGTSEAEEEQLEPPELTELAPGPLSYWIAHAFQENRYTQQGLLEEDSTRTRLLREKDVLESTLKYYSAASALESVFREDKDAPGGAAPLPPPGGPD